MRRRSWRELGTVAVVAAFWIVALLGGAVFAYRIHQPHPEVPRPASLTAQLAPIGPISPLVPPELGEERP